MEFMISSILTKLMPPGINKTYALVYINNIRIVVQYETISSDSIFLCFFGLI